MWLRIYQAAYLSYTAFICSSLSCILGEAESFSTFMAEVRSITAVTSSFGMYFFWFGLSSLAFGPDSVIGMVVLRNLMCLSGLILLTYFLAYFTPDNFFLRILGKYSTEIYLYQFVFLQLTGEILPWPVRIPVVFALTFLSALLLSPLNRLVRRALTGAGNAQHALSSGIHSKGDPHD